MGFKSTLVICLDCFSSTPQSSKERIELILMVCVGAVGRRTVTVVVLKLPLRSFTLSGVCFCVCRTFPFFIDLVVSGQIDFMLNLFRDVSESRGFPVHRDVCAERLLKRCKGTTQ